MKKITALLAVALLSSCTSTKISQSLSSGVIGCAPSAISITNETVNSGVHNFTASCEGKQYYCTYMYPNPTTCKAASK